MTDREFEAPIFEAIATTSGNEITDTMLRRWIKTSAQFEGAHIGMHSGQCSDPSDSCCYFDDCDGHTIIVEVNEDDGATSQVSCTAPDCNGPYL